MSLTELLTRVRVVKSLNEGEKLRIKNGHVCIDRHRPWTPVTRWIFCENRYTAISYLQSLVNEIESASHSDHVPWQILSLRDMVPDLIRALQTMKNTYVDDTLTVAQLDTLIDRLTHVCFSKVTETLRPQTGPARDRSSRPS
jgi:hypothetical protein